MKQPMSLRIYRVACG